LQHDGWCILADTEETEAGNRAPSAPEALDEIWQILCYRGPQENKIGRRR